MISLFIFFIGLSIGSFLNVVIFRLGKKSFFAGRSQCRHCQKQIGFLDNIPVVSFFLLKGKCRNCKTKISYQYPLVEFFTGLIFVWHYFLFGLSAQFLFYIIITSFLIVIFVYDLKHYLILDKISIPAITIAFGFNLYLGLSLTSLLLAGALGAGFFAFQYFISQGRWVGDGDIRLGALMGLILGLKFLFIALFLAYLVGSIFGLALIALKKKEMSSEVPFGPFLTAATLVVMMYGQEILNWYFSILF